MLLAEAVEKTRMPKAKSVLFAASVAISSIGLVIIGVGAFFLKRLDDQAFEILVFFTQRSDIMPR